MALDGSLMWGQIELIKLLRKDRDKLREALTEICRGQLEHNEMILVAEDVLNMSDEAGEEMNQ